MKVYLRTEAGRRAPRQSLYVAPGAEPAGQDGPAEWWDADRRPVTLPVTFAFGVAEVPDTLGRFLIAAGHAQRTALILPVNF